MFENLLLRETRIRSFVKEIETRALNEREIDDSRNLLFCDVDAKEINDDNIIEISTLDDLLNESDDTNTLLRSVNENITTTNTLS